MSQDSHSDSSEAAFSFSPAVSSEALGAYRGTSSIGNASTSRYALVNRKKSVCPWAVRSVRTHAAAIRFLA